VHELKLAPHGAERAPLHPHGSRETLLVTAGRVIVQSAAEQRVLGPGDTCMIAGDAERYYVNPDATDAVMYAMVAPERGPAPLSRCARRR
jgi:quercetin dioxygenase-like cupin family protein